MFNFNFGKKGPDKKQIIIYSILISSIISILSQCSGVTENRLWDLLDEIQRKYFPQTIINEIIRKDEEKINRRISRDVDKAIREYENLTGDSGQVKMNVPLYSEIDGVMRLCSPWVDGCTGDSIDVINEKNIEIKFDNNKSNKVNFFKF